MIAWDRWQNRESKCGNKVDIEPSWLFWRKSSSDFWFCRNKGWPGFESFFTSKSSLQDSLHNPLQLWLMSVLNKQLRSLCIFQFPVGWQRKDMQYRGLKEIICLTFAGLHGCTSLKAAAFSHSHSQYRLVHQVEGAGLTDRKFAVLSASNTCLQRCIYNLYIYII